MEVSNQKVLELLLLKLLNQHKPLQNMDTELQKAFEQNNLYQPMKTPDFKLNSSSKSINPPNSTNQPSHQQSEHDLYKNQKSYVQFNQYISFYMPVNFQLRFLYRHILYQISHEKFKVITFYFKMNNKYDYLFKFIVIGDSNVGKSCLLLRFTQGKYKSQHQPTLGVQFGSKNLKISDMIIKIQIWDTAGQQSFKSITRSYYKGSIAALIVYDITKKDTFDDVLKWIHEVKTHSNEKVQILLVGNKSDASQKRQVPFQQGEKLAKKHGFGFFETSAANGENVQEIFRHLANKIVKKIENNEINPQTESNYGFRKGTGTKNKRENSTIQIKKPPVVQQIKKQNQKCAC